MCEDCGCGRPPIEPAAREHGADHHHHDHAHDHDHHHEPHHHHDHGHDHSHEVPAGEARTVEVKKRILAHNDGLATQLRTDFTRHGVLAVNLVSSPGAGKTELLPRTLLELKGECAMAAVTGDLATENDADRLSGTGTPVRQILTGTMCHLEADMVSDAIAGWDLSELDLLFIENVGNMVCPSSFDLGEGLRVMLVATTEGEDKPLKYPTLTISADVAVINKVDLAEVVECDLDRLERNLKEVNPGIEVIRTSARTGEGVDSWLNLLRRRANFKATAPT